MTWHNVLTKTPRGIALGDQYNFAKKIVAEYHAELFRCFCEAESNNHMDTTPEKAIPIIRANVRWWIHRDMSIPAPKTINVHFISGENVYSVEFTTRATYSDGELEYIIRGGTEYNFVKKYEIGE